MLTDATRSLLLVLFGLAMSGAVAVAVAAFITISPFVLLAGGAIYLISALD